MSAVVVLGSGHFVRQANADAIANGDLVVTQIGDGSAALSSAATAVFINEYAITGGTQKQQIALPTATLTGALTNSGTATSEGFITNAASGGYLTLGGYDAAVGTASVASTASATTPRVIGFVNTADGSVDVSTQLNTFSGNNIRSTFSLDGISAYAGGAAAGPAYATKGATTATAITTNTNQRVVNGYNGDLYFSSSSGANKGILKITGDPTNTGNTATLLINTGGSPYDFAFASSSVVYIADDAATTSGGGIQKWTLTGSTWSKVYTLTPDGTVGERGLALAVSGDVVSIYATTAEASLNKLVSVTDSLSATALPTGITYATLETAAANTIFRGVELVPEPTSVSAIALTGLITLRRRRRNA